MQVNRYQEQLIFTIGETHAGKTIRTFLQDFHLARKKIHELYMTKQVLLNSERVNFETKLKNGDLLAICDVFQEETIDFIPQKMKLDIIYEDDHLLIINKPAGIMVHPDQKEGRDTLVNGVAYYYQEQGISKRVRYIHRLDTQTSGGIIFAKHYLAHSLMDYWLSEKKIRRWYLALVMGRLNKKSGTINAPIGKDRHHGARRRVAKNGDSATTLYRVVKQYKNYALVELELKTGRTHQIRVHMSHIGHPLVGDTLYGGIAKMGGLKRHALHSYRIEMPHPITTENLVITIPIPKDMKSLI